MLQPKLTNCAQCSDINFLIKDIDCALSEMSITLYNNVIFILNKSINTESMLDLINYKRILLYKMCNPDYAGCYSVNMIASKIKKYTIGCKKKCVYEAIIPPTTTTTTVPPTTTTTTTACPSHNLVVNPTFNENFIGWNQTIYNSWVWSSFNGGSANYTGQDEGSMLFQNILTPGETYDVSFDLWMDLPLAHLNLFWVKVFTGTTEYGPFKIDGNQTINLIMACTGNGLFGIQAYDADMAPKNTIFIDNIYVSKHCSGFTTTTTTNI